MKKSLIALLPLLTACATKSEVLNLPPDSGVKAVYKESYEKVKIAAQHTALELGFKQKQEGMKDEHTYYFYSSQGIGSGTGGRHLRVIIPAGEAERAVYILVRSKTESNDNHRTDDLIAQDMHKRIATRLAAK